MFSEQYQIWIREAVEGNDGKQTLGPCDWGSNPALLLAGSITLSKQRSLSWLEFSHLWREGNNRSYPHPRQLHELEFNRPPYKLTLPVRCCAVVLIVNSNEVSTSSMWKNSLGAREVDQLMNLRQEASAGTGCCFAWRCHHQPSRGLHTCLLQIWPQFRFWESERTMCSSWEKSEK